MLRRNLFRAIAAGAAASLRGQPVAASASKPVTRRIDEMTSREVEFYLKEGGDLVFVPFGPVSGHGALIPMGMHAHWASALSLLLAEKANGLVFPTTFACFAGATRTFQGTISFPIHEQVSVLKRIASGLHASGFKRTVLIAGTNPEDTGGIIAARSLFDETETPYWYLQGLRILEAPEIRAMYAGYPGNFGGTMWSWPACGSWDANAPFRWRLGRRKSSTKMAATNPRNSPKTSSRPEGSGRWVSATSRKGTMETTVRRASCSMGSPTST